MATLHDELAEISAKAAFENFKAGDKTREEFKKLLATVWEHHEPQMRVAASLLKVEYEFQITADYDFSMKEIEADMLPPAWAEFHNQGHTFNWKFENEKPFRYSFKFRWGCKRGVILNDLKSEWKAQQEMRKRQRAE